MEVQEIKRYLNKTVTAPEGSRYSLRGEGIRYKLTGATIRLNEMGEYWYQAELQDLTALRSVRICKLTDIEIAKE